MAASRSSTILLRGNPIVKEGPGKAATTINPGYLMQLDSDGTYGPHATAGGAAEKLFAMENAVYGKDINTSYDIGTQIQLIACHGGMEVQAKLAAAATAVTKGALLESAGNGTVRNHGTGVVIGVALESVDNSGGGSEAFINISLI